MKKEACIIMSLVLLFIISLIINMQITGKVIFESENIRIRLITPENFYEKPPYKLEAYCDINLICKDLAFYYFPSEFIIDEETKKLKNLTRPENISDFKLLCDEILTEKNVFAPREYPQVKRMDKFSCDWNFEEEDYDGDMLVIIAIAKDKNNSTIYSDTRGRLIGEKTKWFRLFERIESYIWVITIVLLLILAIFTFWLGNLIINKFQKEKENGYI